jgi:type I restriction enzyme S subunit
LNTALYVKDFHGNDQRFVYYFLRTIDFRAYNSGSAQPSLNRNFLHPIKVRIPPPSEQRAIAGALGALDDKIELNRRMNETLEGMARAVFRSWFVDFDPVIDNALRAGNPIPDPLADRAARRKLQLAHAKTEGHPTLTPATAALFPNRFQDSPLGPIPEGWTVSSLGERCYLVMGQSPKSEFYNEDGDGLPFHQGVRGFGERFPTHNTFCTMPNRLAEAGDILFSVRAPVGRINVADRQLIVGRGLAAIRDLDNAQSFLLHALKHKFQEEDSIGSGTVFAAVTKKDMEGVVLPPSAQDAVASFEKVAGPLDRRYAKNVEESRTLAAIRDALLPKLLSGEIRINAAEMIVGEVA